jgi:hypothetical protein
MSEFSSSVHFPGARPEDVAEIVLRSGDAGIVFRDAGRCVCAVTRQLDKRGGIELAARATDGVVLYYSYAGDHGCWVNLYERGRLVTKIVHTWDDPKSRFDPAPWKERGVLNEHEALEMVEEVQRTDHRTMTDPRVYYIAQLLGLRQYQWIGPRELQRNEADLRTFHPDFGDFIIVGEAFGK